MKKKNVLAFLCVMLCAIFISCTPSSPKSPNTWEWECNGDTEVGGSSTIIMIEDMQEKKPAYKFTGNITDEYYFGYACVQAKPDTATLERLKNVSAISFKVLGNGEKYAIKIVTSDVKDFGYFEAVFDTVDGVPTTVILPVDRFMQPLWSSYIGDINPENAMYIEFQTTRDGTPGPFEFTLWDLRVWTDAVPTEKQVK